MCYIQLIAYTEAHHFSKFKVLHLINNINEVQVCSVGFVYSG